jgi:membrane protein
MPSEFPERWSRFLPPEDVTARLRTHVKSTHTKSTGDQSNAEPPPPADK